MRYQPDNRQRTAVRIEALYAEILEAHRSQHSLAVCGRLLFQRDGERTALRYQPAAFIDGGNLGLAYIVKQC